MIQKRYQHFPWEAGLETPTPTPTSAKLSTPSSDMYMLGYCDTQSVHSRFKRELQKSSKKQCQKRNDNMEFLHHNANPFTESSIKRPTTLAIISPRKSLPLERRQKNTDQEVPLIEQLLSKRDTNTKCRRELVPVDEKAKLYFAYNRNSGTITRVITTSPRPFRFGKK